MSSTNYEIKWDTVGEGGNDTSSSATYQLRDSVGTQGAGSTTSTSYRNDAGYRGGVYDRVADFEVMIQYRNSQVAATALVGNIVTVGSIGSIVVGDLILVVDNEGNSQDSAIGRVIDVTGTDVTVDEWVHSGSMPTIDGSQDYVYEMASPTLSLGTLPLGDVATGAIAWEVSADVADGYRVYIYEDHDLRKASDIAQVITDVADGTVTFGATEYGAKSSDSSLSSSTFDTQDTSFTTSFQEIASRTTNSFNKRDFLTVKAARNASVVSGTYTHTLTIIYVGDY